MSTQVWALSISTISAGIGLTTLSLVIRNELRERRQQSSILWSLQRYATRTGTDDGGKIVQQHEVAELVQFGRQPTRIMSYQPVGFSLSFEEGYRLRSHVKAEDTLPLLLQDVDPDNAWLLISHYPRDDRRWLVYEWVPLEPSSGAFRDACQVAQEKLRASEGRWRKALRVARPYLPKRSVVRPVGPAGHRWARLRADKGLSDSDVAHITTITSLAGNLSYPTN